MSELGPYWIADRQIRVVHRIGRIINYTEELNNIESEVLEEMIEHLNTAKCSAGRRAANFVKVSTGF